MGPSQSLPFESIDVSERPIVTGFFSGSETISADLREIVTIAARPSREHRLRISVPSFATIVFKACQSSGVPSCGTSIFAGARAATAMGRETRLLAHIQQSLLLPFPFLMIQQWVDGDRCLPIALSSFCTCISLHVPTTIIHGTVIVT